MYVNIVYILICNQTLLTTGITELTPGGRYASFDGDADRIVYFYKDHGKSLIIITGNHNSYTIVTDYTFHLLDGDKIATLVRIYYIIFQYYPIVFDL